MKRRSCTADEGGRRNSIGRRATALHGEQCVWLKDRYGLSWQIVPAELGRTMGQGTPAQVARVTQAFLQMKKFDIARLREAYAD